MLGFFYTELRLKPTDVWFYHVIILMYYVDTDYHCMTKWEIYGVGY